MRLTVLDMGGEMRWMPGMTAAYADDLSRLQARIRAEVWREAANLLDSHYSPAPTRELKIVADEFRIRAEKEGQ